MNDQQLEPDPKGPEHDPIVARPTDGPSFLVPAENPELEFESKDEPDPDQLTLEDLGLNHDYVVGVCRSRGRTPKGGIWTGFVQPRKH